MRKVNDGFCGHEGCQSRSMVGEQLCAEHQAQIDSSTKIQIKTASPEIREATKSSVDYVKNYDPVIEGSKLAQRLIAEEEAERLKYWQEQQERSPGAKMKKRAPSKLHINRPRTDITKMVDPANGQDLVDLGYSGRWIREIGNDGKPSDQRVEEFKEEGYTVIRTSSGEPLRSIFGVAMQAPVREYAHRIARSMPVGALDRNSLSTDVGLAIEQVNKAAGDRVVGVVKDPDHGRQRFEHGHSDRLIEEG